MDFRDQPSIKCFMLLGKGRRLIVIELLCENPNGPLATSKSYGAEPM